MLYQGFLIKSLSFLNLLIIFVKFLFLFFQLYFPFTLLYYHLIYCMFMFTPLILMLIKDLLSKIDR